MKDKFLGRWFVNRRSVALLLVVFLAAGGIGLAGFRSKTRAFYGLDADANHGLDYASSRYTVLAPFAPSPDKDGVIPEVLDQMDNHYVYLFDTKKPKSEPIAADLIYCYYPSKVYFDEKKSVVLVRGVEYVEPEAGAPRIGDILVHVGLRLESDQKPYFEDVSIAPIRIEDPSSSFDGQIPGDFFVGYDDNIVLLTNGEAIISINRTEAYRYSVYFTGSKITYLDYNDSARLVTVGLSRIVELEDGSCGYFSEVRFYELERSGVINLKSRITEDRFPEGVGLMPGSSAVIARSEVVDDRVQSFLAYFPTSDGSLWSVDFVEGADSGTESVTKFSKLGVVPELRESICGQEPEARSLVYDSQRRTITVVRRGSGPRIYRPSLARVAPRGIYRPSLVEVRGESVIAVVGLDKKGNMTGYRAIKDELEGKGRLTNLIVDENVLYIATYEGDVFSLVPVEGDMSGLPSLRRVGKLGSRLGYISRWDEDGVFVGMSSFELDSEGRYLGFGGLALGKFVLPE